MQFVTIICILACNVCHVVYSYTVEHTVDASSWGGNPYTYQGRCTFYVDSGVTSWTVNITFNKDCNLISIWSGILYSKDTGGLWHCINHQYNPSQQWYSLSWHAQYQGSDVPYGYCIYQPNVNDACLSLEPPTTTTTTKAPTTTTTTKAPTTTTTTKAPTTTSTTTRAQTTTSTTTRAPTTSTTTRALTTSTTTTQAPTTTSTTTRAPTTTTQAPTTTTTTQAPTTTTTTQAPTTTTTTQAPTTTTPTQAPTTTATNDTYCLCVNISGSVVTTDEEFEEVIRNLTLNKRALSFSRRQRSSAPDDRVSSRSIGMVGVTVTVISVGLLCVADISIYFSKCKSTPKHKKSNTPNGKK